MTTHNTVDIAEQICLAVDQIVSERIKAINYDTTIIATIENNTYKEKGKYTCSNGSANFIAYSKDTTFEVGESVLITIPNNDYDQQKVIVGRYVVDNLKPFGYVRPFDTIIDVSSNLISGVGDRITSLLANEDYDNGTNLTNFPLWSSTFQEPQSGFTRLGIQGQFRSWIQGLDPAPLTGHYGYALELYFYNGKIVEKNKYLPVTITRDEYQKDPIKYYITTISETTGNIIYQQLPLGTPFDENTNYYIQNLNYFKCLKQWCELYSYIISRIIVNEAVDIQYYHGLFDSTPEQWFEQIGYKKEDYINIIIDINNNDMLKDMVWIILNSQGEFQTFEFDSMDMYGDPNGFQSFYEQEVVFDISNMTDIMMMTLHFYQKSGSFYTIKEDPLPYKYEGGAKFLDNLFTKDPYICLGYDLQQFDSEQAIIYCIDSPTYSFLDKVENKSENNKTIRLRWLHEFDDGQIQVITEESVIPKYEVRWYRFKNGSPSADEYSGVYWKLVHSQIIENTEAKDNNAFTYVLEPQAEMQQEQIKAIVLYDGQIIRSNILTFTNQQEVPNQTTMDLLSGLSIWCDDGSYGNYYLYGQTNELFDPNKANEILTLKAKFIRNNGIITLDADDVGKDAYDLTEATRIIWEFPLTGTMLNLHGFDYTNKQALDGASSLSDDNTTVVVDAANNVIKITRVCDIDGQINNALDYRIKRTYSATYINNTIKCTIEKDIMNYSATKEFSFGIMGTNGTDVTLVIDFDHNRTALSANKEEAVGLTAYLYDQSHKLVDFNDEGLELTCDWDWYVKYPETSNLFRIVEENKNTCKIEHGITSIANPNSYFLIIQATVKGWGDYDLTAVKSIPIRADAKYRNVIGPTEVIYDSAGNIDYYREPYEMWWCPDINKINIEQDTVASQIDVKKDNSVTWDIVNPFGEEENYIGTLSDKYILKPAPLYIQDTACYGVCCKQNGVVVWIQPIYIGLNRYPNSTINKWDGKYMVTNEGQVLAPAIAAGKKNSDNTFNGVMLGDWEQNADIEQSIAGQTGLYGFDHGEQTFGFTDAGQGFIGKSGVGRIIFDGTNGTITSGAYNVNEGMKLNLRLGTIDAHQFTLDAGKRAVVRDPETGEIYEVAESILDAQHEAGISAEDADIDIELGDAYSNTIYISTEADMYPVRVGSNFSLDWYGNLYAKSGYFNGDIVGSNLFLPEKDSPNFFIDSEGNLYCGSVDLEEKTAVTTLTSNGFLSITHGQITLGEGYDDEPVFKLTDDGELTMTHGSISLGRNDDGTYVFTLTDNGYLTMTEGQISLGSRTDINGQVIYDDDGKPLPVFKLEDDGTLTMTQGSITLGEMYNKEGEVIPVFELLDDGTLTMNQGSISLGLKDDGDYAFGVTNEGEMHAEIGDIGGWVISPTSLSNSNVTGEDKVTISLNSPPSTEWTLEDDPYIVVQVGDDQFTVNSDGIMTAKGGTIGGWTFYEGDEDPLRGGPSDRPWNSLYTEVSGKYTVIDAGRDNIIAIGLAEENAFQEGESNNHNFAPFRVRYDGSLYIGTKTENGIVVTPFKVTDLGEVTASDMHITGGEMKISNAEGNVVFHIDETGNLKVGGTQNETTNNPAFSVDNQGNLKVGNTLDNPFFSIDNVGNLKVGGTTDSSAFLHIDQNGNLKIGNTLENPNFSVDNKGNLKVGGENPSFSVSNDGTISIKKGEIKLGGTEAAPNFSVNSEGQVTIRKGEIRLGGTETYPAFHADINGNLKIGASSSYPDGKFYAESNGKVTAQNLVVTGTSQFGTGSGAFKIGESGNVFYMGAGGATAYADDSGFGVASSLVYIGTDGLSYKANNGYYSAMRPGAIIVVGRSESAQYMSHGIYLQGLDIDTSPDCKIFRNGQGQLDIDAEDEINLNSSTINLNANTVNVPLPGGYFGSLVAYFEAFENQLKAEIKQWVRDQDYATQEDVSDAESRANSYTDSAIADIDFGDLLPG